MARYYDPYKDLDEYKEPNESQVSKWLISGIAAAGGIAAAIKMKSGPLGKMVASIEQNKIARNTQQEFQKHSHLAYKQEFRMRIPTGLTTRAGKQRIFEPGHVPNPNELQFAQDILYERIGMRGAGKEMAMKTEKEIEGLLSGRKNIAGIDIGRESIITKSTDNEIAAKVMLARFRREALTEHIGSDAKYMDGAPNFDIFDLEGPNTESTNYKNIDEVHQFYLENDPIYSKKYARIIDEYKKKLSAQSAAHVASNPNIGQYSPDMDDRMVKRTFGGPQELRSKYQDISISPDHNKRLYSGQSKSMITAEMLDKKVNDIISAKSKIRKTSLTKYGGAARKLVLSLERLRALHPDDIIETAIEENGYNKAFGDSASYLNVIIKRKVAGKANYDITIPIPIVQDHILPGLTTNSRQYINANMAADFISDKPIVDTTEQIMYKMASIIGSVFNHEIVESPNPRSTEDKLRRMVDDTLRTLTPVSGEMRDYFQTQGLRVGVIEQLVNSKSSEMARSKLNAGVTSMGYLKKIAKNSDQYDVLVLDLETINLTISSPGKTPLHPDTNIWQAGFTYANGNGSIMQADQITSDHILREIPELRGDVSAAQLRAKMNANTEKGKALREYATFAKRTLTKAYPNERPPADEAEALLLFKKHVSNAASPASAGRRKDRRIPKTKADFVTIIGNTVRNYERQAAKRGKKLVLVDANGTYFDRALLNNLAPNFGWLSRPAIDLQAVNYAMTLGYYDADSRSVNALLQTAMQKANLSSEVDIVDFENMASETIDKISSGPNAIIRMHSKSKSNKIWDYLRGRLGENTMQAHGAGLDTVATLGLLQLYKRDREMLNTNRFNTLSQLVKDVDSFGIKQAFERAFSTEGWAPPGAEGMSFSSSLMSAGKMFKGHGSFLHLGAFMPLYVENPLTKAPQQVYRNIWVKKNSVVNKESADFRFRNPLRTPMVLEAEKWMHSRADWRGNQLAHQVQFNTIYTLGTPGGKTSGELIVTRDAMDWSAYDVKITPFSELENQIGDGPLANKIMQFKNEVDIRARKMAQETAVNRRHQGSEVTADIWWRASQQIRSEWERSNTSMPHIDPNTKITSFLNEGGKMRKIKAAMGGEILGFTLDAEVAGSSRNTGAGLMVAIGSSTNLKNGLDMIAFNHHMTKSVVTMTDNISAGVAWGKAAKLGPIEAQMNFDFLDKGYWGSLKTAMLNKAISLAYRRTKKTTNTTQTEKARADSSLRKIVSKLNESYPAQLDGEGVIRWGPTSYDEKMSKSLHNVANNLKIDDILDMLKTVGHEATWDTQTFNLWYNRFGSNITESRNNMRSIVTGMRSQAQKSIESTDSMGIIKSMNTLLDHYDPLTIVEQNLRKRNALKGGSIEKHWSLINDRDRNDLLGQVPIFMQMVPTQTGLREGMFAFSQTFTPYGVEGNKTAVNHMVKFQANYFQQFIHSSHLTPTTKKVLMSGQKWKKSTKSIDALKNLMKLYDSSSNKSVSELYTKHALSIEEIRSLSSRKETEKVIKKHLNDVLHNRGVEGITYEDMKVKNGLRQIGAFSADTLADSDYDLDRALGTIRDPEQILKALRERWNWTTVDEVKNVWQKISAEKGGAFYIPLRKVKSGGETIKLRDKPFTFVLEDVMDSITSAPGRNKPKVNSDRFIKSLVRQSRDALSELGPDEKLFNIELTREGDKLKHVVTLNGMFLPTGETADAFWKQEAGKYGRYSELAQIIQQTGWAYDDYVQEAVRSRKLGAEGALGDKENALSQHWLKMMMYTYSYNKNNPAFNALQFEYPGIQPIYAPADYYIEKAKGILSGAMGGRHGEMRKKYGKALENISDGSINRVFMTTGMFDRMYNEGQRVLSPGSNGGIKTMELAKMIAGADDQVKAAIHSARLGESSLPGGIFTRNPIGPNGLFGALNAELALVPDELAGVLGMTNEKIYAPAIFGALVKADSDRDRAVYMQLGFSTIEQLNKMRVEQRNATTSLMDMAESKRVFDVFNSEKFHTGITSNPNTGQLETQIVSVVTNRSDPDYGKLRFSAPTKASSVKNLISTTSLDSLDKLIGQMMIGGRGERAIETHLSTIALVSASKRVIPLITNTVRQRIGDMFRGSVVSSKSLNFIQSNIGGLETGLTTIMQESIKIGKHSSGLEAAQDIISLHESLRNPGGMNLEQWDGMKKRLRKSWGTSIEADKAEIFLDLAMGHSTAVDRLRKLDPGLDSLIYNEEAILYGRNITAPEFGDYISSQNNRKRHTLNKTASIATAAAREAGILNPEPGNITDKFDLKVELDRMIRNRGKAKDLLQGAMETSMGLSRGMKQQPSVLGSWFGEPKARMFKGKIAKAGAIGAMLYLGLNFFKPNQLNGGPGNMFINLGTDSGGENNLWKSELELPRGMPLDQVQSGFQQSASIEPNENNYKAKSQQQDIYNSLFRAKLQNTFGLQLQSNSQANISYKNYTNRTGSFNSYDIARRMKNYEYDRG